MKFGYGSRESVEPDDWCYEVVVQDFCSPTEFEPEFGEEKNLPYFGLLFCVHIPVRDLSTVYDAILDYNQAVAANQTTETAIKLD